MPTLRVALRVDTVITDTPSSYVQRGDTFSLLWIESEASLGPAVSAGRLVEQLVDGLDAGTLPVTTDAVELELAAAPPTSLIGAPLDIVLFTDTNRDGTWQAGEPYVTAWSGGRGSYRVVFFESVPADAPGATAGWNVIEGGMPVRYTPPGSQIVYLNPLNEPIPRQ